MKLKNRLNNVLLSSVLVIISPLICAKGWQVNDYPSVVTGSSIYIEPNVMLLLDSSGSMAGTLSGSEKKIEAAKGAIKSLADDPVLSRQARLGLAKLGSAGSSKAGGEILVGCSADSAEGIKTAVDGIKATGQTPITEAYYEITRYFRGLHGRYYRLRGEDAEVMNAEGISTGSEKNADGTYPTYLSPIDQKYGQCQENHIVVLTDGSPTRDGFKDEGDYDEIYPHGSNDETDITAGELTGMTDDQLIGAETLPDWNLNVNDEDVSKYYLDDIALWAKTGLDLSASHAEQQPLITHTISYGLDIARANDMLERAAKEHVNPETGAVVLDSATESALKHPLTGQYFKADTNEQMVKAFREIITGIVGDPAGKSNPIGLSGTSVGEGFTSFKTAYMSGDWTGSIVAETWIVDQSSTKYGNKSEKWNTSTQARLSPGERQIITNIGDEAVPFIAENFSSSTNASSILSSDVVDFFRGTDLSGSGEFRDWGQSAFGTFINSKPVYVDYSTTQPDKQQAMIFVGGNDGMLHGFDAENGKQTFSYIPGSLLEGLASITEPGARKHRYFVDGSPYVAEVGDRKLLVGGLSGGGQSIYTLDITEPDKLTEANADQVFLGEFMHKNLGYTFSRPQIMQFNNDKWYLVFGGGYPGAADSELKKHQVAIYIVPVVNNKPKFKKVKVVLSSPDESIKSPSNHDKPNGLSTLTAFNTDGKAGVDVLYGGDLYGNTWKFNVTGEKVKGKGKKKGKQTIKLSSFDSGRFTRLFRACASYDEDSGECDPATYQPVTSDIAVTKVDNKVMLLFGTGKDFEVADNASKTTQSLYAVYDDGVFTNKGDLFKQEISSEADGYRYFQEENKIKSSDPGWFIDLKLTGGEAEGERVLYAPYIGPESTLAIFSTRIYSQKSEENVCDAGVYETQGWYYFIDPASGGMPQWHVFDTNGDGKIDDDDVLSGGMKTGDGGEAAIAPPCDPNDPTCEEQDKCKSIDIRTGRVTQLCNPRPSGRQSWQQLIRNQ
ncbi:PilC/PilY family type IV pilus protein [Amphritea sp. HPY]|uniref:PilC/PilY family type IV pilus protein n=1 Tax=Amphritea sp. HPY TaxID=3421652 RepID=UPI003D7DFF39